MSFASKFIFIRTTLCSLFSLIPSCFQIFPEETWCMFASLSSSDARLRSLKYSSSINMLPCFESAWTTKSSRLLRNGIWGELTVPRLDYDDPKLACGVPQSSSSAGTFPYSVCKGDICGCESRLCASQRPCLFLTSAFISENLVRLYISRISWWDFPDAIQSRLAFKLFFTLTVSIGLVVLVTCDEHWNPCRVFVTPTTINLNQPTSTLSCALCWKNFIRGGIAERYWEHRLNCAVFLKALFFSDLLHRAAEDFFMKEPQLTQFPDFVLFGKKLHNYEDESDE